MTTLLVANRGEIAVRIFRTAKRMGIRCAAAYSDADANAMFVREAHVAARLGPVPPDPPASTSYLDITAVIAAAKELEADLIHPGYGFLAENAEFAEACEAAGITFIGPSPKVLRAMGSKDEARRLAVEAGVPVLAGYADDDQSDEAFLVAAGEIGYPVIVKPAGGGGGKGMGIAHSADGLPGILASARRVGLSAFGGDRLIMERYLTGAHHVEVQILADTHGNVIHLGERDCSLQRRHQKILEESPSPAVDKKMRDLLCESAVNLARRVGYVGAGTCEFIVAGDQAAFLEMNTRLQVEHPVTEMVTGIDLVEMQIRVAMGEKLSIGKMKPKGHAIEVRIYAEDPDNGFLPQSGRVEHLRWPGDTRIDSGIEEGDEISPLYDPMVAKLIVHDRTREAAIQRLAGALDQVEILGVMTNVAFLRDVISRPEVALGTITTSWLESLTMTSSEHSVPDEVVALAAAAEAARLLDTAGRRDPWARLGSFRLSSDEFVEVPLVQNGSEIWVRVSGAGPFRVMGHTVDREDEESAHGLQIDGAPAAAVRSSHTTSEGHLWFVWWRGRQFDVPLGPLDRSADEAGAAHLEAPMPGQVIAVRVAAGDKIIKGQELVVVEAMKMEHSIRAPLDGVVEAVLCAVGDRVDRGRTLVRLTSGGRDSQDLPND